MYNRDIRIWILLTMAPHQSFSFFLRERAHIKVTFPIHVLPTLINTLRLMLTTNNNHQHFPPFFLIIPLCKTTVINWAPLLCPVVLQYLQCGSHGYYPCSITTTTTPLQLPVRTHACEIPYESLLSHLEGFFFTCKHACIKLVFYEEHLITLTSRVNWTLATV